MFCPYQLELCDLCTFLHYSLQTDTLRTVLRVIWRRRSTRKFPARQRPAYDLPSTSRGRQLRFKSDSAVFNIPSVRPSDASERCARYAASRRRDAPRTEPQRYTFQQQPPPQPVQTAHCLIQSLSLLCELVFFNLFQIRAPGPLADHYFSNTNSTTHSAKNSPYKLLSLLERLPSKQNLRVANCDKVGGIPRYFTRDWRRIEEDKSRTPRPIIKTEFSSSFTTTHLCSRLGEQVGNCSCTSGTLSLLVIFRCHQETWAE